MTSEQHKAEMITLHSNLMNAQSKVKKDIKFLTEKRDLILKNTGGVATMNDAEKRNYEMFCSLIENSNNYSLIAQAVIKKYQDNYNEVCELVKSDLVPQIKAEFVEYLNTEFNQFIFDSFQKKFLNAESAKTINNQKASPLTEAKIKE